MKKNYQQPEIWIEMNTAYHVLADSPFLTNEVKNATSNVGIGYRAYSIPYETGNGNTAIGAWSSIGSKGNASQIETINNSTAIGYNSEANGNNSVSVGYKAVTDGDYSLAIGCDIVAKSNETVI